MSKITDDYNRRQIFNLISKDIGALAFRKSLQQKGFVISEEFDVGADGGTNNVHFRNPSGTGKTAIIVDVTASTQFEGKATIYEDFDSTTDGTSVTIQNIVMDTNKDLNEGVMEAFTDSTFTGEVRHSSIVFGGGAEKETVGGGGNLPLISVEPDRELVVELLNDSANIETATLLITYFEIDGVPSQETIK